jgi:hypothetical protein
VVVRTKTVHRNLRDKANRVRNPKGQTWATSLDKVRQVVTRVANRDSLVSRAEEEIRVPNQEDPILAVQALTETGSRTFPALKTMIQIWIRIWNLARKDHALTGLPDQINLLAEEACDCTINSFKRKIFRT